MRKPTKTFNMVIIIYIGETVHNKDQNSMCDDGRLAEYDISAFWNNSSFL